jgi:hypothetical protein
MALGLEDEVELVAAVETGPPEAIMQGKAGIDSGGLSQGANVWRREIG